MLHAGSIISASPRNMLPADPGISQQQEVLVNTQLHVQLTTKNRRAKRKALVTSNHHYELRGGTPSAPDSNG